jgi:hypothetical protein
MNRRRLEKHEFARNKIGKNRKKTNISDIKVKVTDLYLN